MPGTSRPEAGCSGYGESVLHGYEPEAAFRLRFQEVHRTIVGPVAALFLSAMAFGSENEPAYAGARCARGGVRGNDGESS